MKPRGFRWPHTPPAGRMVGPGYIEALLAGDEQLVANFRIAFTADELLESLTEPLGLLVRYLGYHIDKTPTEIGDALVRAVRHQKEAPA